jgi:hypothetical protein
MANQEKTKKKDIWEFDVWEFLDEETKNAENVRALVNWSMNYDVRTGTPYQVFLDLIGYSDEHFGESLVKNPSKVLGYLEIDELGNALKEYAKNPEDVLKWIEQLDNIEGKE